MIGLPVFADVHKNVHQEYQTTLKKARRDISNDNPGSAKQSNWLPARDGPFYAIFRVYMPGPSVADGTWKKPQMQPVPLK